MLAFTLAFDIAASP